MAPLAGSSGQAKDLGRLGSGGQVGSQEAGRVNVAACGWLQVGCV